MALIDLDDLEGENSGYDPSENNWQGYLERENKRLRTLLYATARRLNRTYKELESLKESRGLYKHLLPFLRFPREVRDEIYFYSLRSPLDTDTRERSIVPLNWSVDQYPYKPPMPGIVCTNKQIYRESSEVLYSRNIFSFKHPTHLFDFEKQIGPVNRSYIRHIQIWAMVPSRQHPAPSPEGLPRCDYQEFPSHWARSLRDSRLQNVSEMTIEIESLNSGGAFSICSMETPLQQAIEEVLSINRDMRLPRRITLCGFGWNEWEKFPRDIEVITRQWPSVEEEIEGMRREALEYPDDGGFWEW